MDKKSPSVALVILNWNGQQLLERFLPSVMASDYENLQIVVADNASTDDSLAYLASNFPNIRIIVNRDNYGFAGGYNQALKQVNATYYVLLNSDVEVPKNWIKPVIALMERDDKIVIAQPKIKWQGDKSSFEYAGAAGGFMDKWGFTFCRGRLFDTVEQDMGQYNANLPLFWASGAALFIKKTAWEEVNGFDSDLFAHMEEIDLCWRLKNSGYQVMSCGDAEVYHVGGGTLDAGSPYKNYLNFRNNLIIMQKNLPVSEATYKIFIRLWFDLAAWFKFALTGKMAFAFSINKAHYHFFKSWVKTAQKRSAHQYSFRQHQGTYHGSIVWAYFAKKIKKFSELPPKLF